MTKQTTIVVIGSLRVRTKFCQLKTKLNILPPGDLYLGLVILNSEPLQFSNIIQHLLSLALSSGF